MMCSIVHHIVDISAHVDILAEMYLTHLANYSTRRHDSRFRQILASSVGYKFSFFPRVDCAMEPASRSRNPGGFPSEPAGHHHFLIAKDILFCFNLKYLFVSWRIGTDHYLREYSVLREAVTEDDDDDDDDDDDNDDDDDSTCKEVFCVILDQWLYLFYVLLCVILFLCFSVLLALRLPRLGKRES